jgi:hypothetical protein
MVGRSPGPTYKLAGPGHQRRNFGEENDIGEEREKRRQKITEKI